MYGGYDLTPPVSEKDLTYCSTCTLMWEISVKFGENCPKLTPLSLYGLENFLCQVVRDLFWVLIHALGILEVYLPTPIQSWGCVESTCVICSCVMELSGSMISHLLNFKVLTFSKCYLLILLKNTCKHWLNCCSQVVNSLDL